MGGKKEREWARQSGEGKGSDEKKEFPHPSGAAVHKVHSVCFRAGQIISGFSADQ